MTSSLSDPRLPFPLHRVSVRVPGADRLRGALRRGELVYDRVFDEIYPWQARRASSVHWTPVEVALRAAELLTANVSSPSILDIGSGIGKFCIVAAVAGAGAAKPVRVSGIEHRRHFVDIARAAAATIGAQVDLRHGSIANHDPAGYTGFYLFNPFAENVAAREDHLDETVELCRETYWRDVAATQTFFARAHRGARIVTYCGWGGTMPPGYLRVTSERRAGPLELWEKR